MWDCPFKDCQIAMFNANKDQEEVFGKLPPGWLQGLKKTSTMEMKAGGESWQGLPHLARGVRQFVSDLFIEITEFCPNNECILETKEVNKWSGAPLQWRPHSQPFMIFHRQMKKIHPIFDFFDKEKYLAQNLGHFAPSKKGLNKIGSKIALQ